MKLKVNEEMCIGCGACRGICPECFEFNEEGVAMVTVDEIPEDKIEDATDAMEGCPVGAIVEVNDEEKED